METQNSITDNRAVNNRGASLLCLAIAAAMLCMLPFKSVAQNQPAPSKKARAAARAHGEIHRVSNLVGYTVENENGAELGTVKDMVIDLQSGRLAFVIVSSGGFAGIGAKLRAVPVTALSPATSMEKTLALDINLDRWNRAPGFNKSQLEVLNKPAQARWLSRYYGKEWPEAPQSAAKGPPLSPTGRGQEKLANLQLASELKGRGLLSGRIEQRLGNVEGFLVDFKRPDATYVLMEPGPYLRSRCSMAKHEFFAVPMSAFAASPNGSELLSDLSLAQFEDARPLTADNWAVTTPGSGDVRIFRYREK